MEAETVEEGGRGDGVGGDPVAVEPLLKAAEVDALYERSQVTGSLLLLARRLGEAGGKQPEKLSEALDAGRRWVADRL